MITDKKLWRHRKERKEWAGWLQSEDPGLEVVNPYAAGIDIGSGVHHDRCTTGPRSAVKEPWSEGRGHAVDRRVLDSHLQDSRRAWFPGVFG
jgi:hypothetical protein